jgi:hypothetical protein
MIPAIIDSTGKPGIDGTTRGLVMLDDSDSVTVRVISDIALVEVDVPPSTVVVVPLATVLVVGTVVVPVATVVAVGTVTVVGVVAVYVVGTDTVVGVATVCVVGTDTVAQVTAVNVPGTVTVAPVVTVLAVTARDAVPELGLLLGSPP